MSRFLYPNDNTTGRSVALTPETAQLLLGTWPSAQSWSYSLGTSQLAGGATISGGPGFAAACTDGQGNAWLVQYSGKLFELAGNNAVTSSYTLPTTGIFTGCAFVFANRTITPPLDALSVTAACSYSLRKTRAAYAGQCVNVRRSSDDTTTDIGFTGAGDFDTVAFNTFIGSGSNGAGGGIQVSGYVTKWYDQSGHGIDVIQAASGLQPIINARASPLVQFTNSAFLQSASAITSQAQPWTAASECIRTFGFTDLFSPIDTSTAGGLFFAAAANKIEVSDATGHNSCIGTATDSTWHSVVGTASGSASTIMIDGVSTAGTVSTSGLSGTIKMGDLLSASDGFLMSEAMMMPGLTSTQRTTLSQNMSGYWQQSGNVYVLSSDGNIYTPNFSTNGVTHVGNFGVTPCWGLSASGNTLFTMAAGTTLEKFTLSSTTAGTSAIVSGTPTFLTAISATSNAVGAGGYANTTLVSGFTATAYNNYVPLMLATNTADGTIQLWGDTYGENWSLVGSFSVTSPSACAWAGQGIALVTVSTGVQVITRNISDLNTSNLLTLSGAGSLAVSADLQSALVCQPGSNQVSTLLFDHGVWGVGSTVLTGLTSPSVVISAVISNLPSAFIAYASGIAQAQFSNGIWSISNKTDLSYAPTSVFYDEGLQFVYACGTQGGSGHITVLDAGLNIHSSVTYTGSANSLVAANAQIVVTDSTNSSIHVSDGISIKKTYSSLSGVNYINLSAVTLMATNGSATNFYHFIGPYELEPSRFGKLAYLSAGTWNTATLPSGHIPTALGFDGAASCWATTQLNGVYEINVSGTIVASGYQLTPGVQPETTPLGTSSLKFFAGAMYGVQSLFGTVIENVQPSVWIPPDSLLPPNFTLAFVPTAPPPPASQPPPAAPPPAPPGSPPPPAPPPAPPPIGIPANYNIGAYFGPGSSGAETNLAAFNTTVGLPANSLYTYTSGPSTSSTVFTAGASQISSFGNTSRKIIFGFPLCWTGATNAQIAAGTFDSTITSLVSGLVPFKNQIASISLGWHPNATENLPWQSGLATDYVAAFRHVVPLIRAQFPTTPITWDVLAGGQGGGGGQTVVVITNTAQTTFPVPGGITLLDKVEVWAAGGQGSNFWAKPDGGGGGAYAANVNVTVTPLASIPIHIGVGGNNTNPNDFDGTGADGTATWFNSTATLYADPGRGGVASLGNGAGGPGGLASNSIGTIVFDGGRGGATDTNGSDGTGGGGSGGPDGAGIHGVDDPSATGPTAGGGADNGIVAGAAADVAGHSNVLGGSGGGGSNTTGIGIGGTPGGGGGGTNGVDTGPRGGNGQIRITYSVPVIDPLAYYPGDDVVDIIGSDVYESLVTNYAGALTASGGLNWLASMTSVTSGSNTVVFGGSKIAALPLWAASNADSSFLTSMAGWINTNMAGAKAHGYELYDNTHIWQTGAQSLVTYGTVTGNSTCLTQWEILWGNPVSGPPPAPPPPPPPPIAPPPAPGGATRNYLLGFFVSGPSPNISAWLGTNPDFTLNGSFQAHSIGGVFFPPTGTPTVPIIFDIDIIAAGMTYASVIAGTQDSAINATLASIASNSSYNASSIFGFRIDAQFNKTKQWQNAGGSSVYKNAFDHVANLIRAIYPNAKIIFNPVVDPGLLLSGDATTCWPDNANVFALTTYFDSATSGPTANDSWLKLFGSSGTVPAGTEAAGTIGYAIKFAQSVSAKFMFLEWGDTFQVNGDFTAVTKMITTTNTASNNVVGLGYWDAALTVGTTVLSAGAQNLIKSGLGGTYNGTFWKTNTVPTRIVIDSMGINTHIDFNNFGYQNLTNTIAAINYLGIKHIRDCPGNDNDLTGARAWTVVASGTGAKFDAFIGETSQTGADGQALRMNTLAGQGILEAIEGPNEWDDSFPLSQGVDQFKAATMQKNVIFPKGQQLGLPVYNITFGAGWVAPLFLGDYGTVGDLSAFCDYANPHTYPTVGATTFGTIARLNTLAHNAASSRPIICTELGWNNSQFSTANSALFALQGVFDNLLLGVLRSYWYALFDDGSGLFGMMNTDATPHPSGLAIHNLMALLADNALLPNRTDVLNYTTSGAIQNDKFLVMQRSTGVFLIAAWNESDANHNVTFDFGTAQASINTYRPLTTTVAATTASNVQTVVLSVGAEVRLVEVTPPAQVLSNGTPSNILLSMFGAPNETNSSSPLGVNTTDLTGRPLDANLGYVNQHDFNLWSTGQGGLGGEPIFYNTYICWDPGASNIPGGLGSFNLATAAAGGYDSYYTSMAHGMANASTKIYAIGINNEFNLQGTWPWSLDTLGADVPGTNANNYRIASQKLITAIRSAYAAVGKPAPKIGWKTNCGHADPVTNVYPGDAFIDIIVMDLYAGIGFSGSSSANCYANALAGGGPYNGHSMVINGTTFSGWGLDAMIAFANFHGKPVGFDEWGWNWGNAGNTDMGYLNSFLTWIGTHNVAYHSYWDSDSSAFSSNPQIKTTYNATYANTVYSGTYFTHF